MAQQMSKRGVELRRELRAAALILGLCGCAFTASVVPQAAERTARPVLKQLTHAPGMRALIKYNPATALITARTAARSLRWRCVNSRPA